MNKAASLVLLGSLLFTNCTEQPKPDKSSKKYFDLAGYFKLEAQRLEHSAPYIHKMVTKDALSEEKTLKIRNWNNELALFVSSDINRSSWRDLYQKHQAGDTTEYSASDPKLRTRKITLVRTSKNISSIAILNKSDNSLYSSEEELTYYPDSLYRIRKEQKILLIGTSNYLISGTIKK